MARGGWRPGGGRPPGIKETKPRRRRKTKAIEDDELTPEDREDIRLLLSFGERFKDGGTLTRTEMRQLEEIGERLGPLTPAEMKLRDEILESFR